MNPSEKNLLQQIIELTLDLPLEEQIIVIVYVLKRWLRYHIVGIHPTRLLFPVTLTQIILFAVTLYTSERPLPILAIGNFIIVGIAIFPMTLTPLSFRRGAGGEVATAHWINSDD